MGKSRKPTCGQQDSPAKTSLLHEWGLAQGLEGNDQASFMTLLGSLGKFCPELFSSRTFQACSLPTEDETSKSLFERWPNSGMLLDGVFLTARASESPSLVNESILLDVIETGELPQRYFLSPNAAKGMLSRADRMGRKLFPPLREALEILSKAH